MIATLKRDIDWDKKGISIVKIMLDTVTFNWGDALKEGVDMVAAEMQVEERAFILIYSSLIEAFHQIGNKEENQTLFAGIKEKTNPNPKTFETLKKQLDSALDEAELEIDDSFFDQPGELPFLKQAAIIFAV